MATTPEEATSAEVEQGGALPGALPVLASAWAPGMNGAELARALADRGLEVPDRDARRLVALLRADPAPSSNGHHPALATEGGSQ